MTASAVVKFTGEVSGLGNDKRVSARAALSDVPTQASGPLYQVITTAVTPVDVVSLVSGELLAVYVKAVSNSVWFNPVHSASPALTVSNYIPEGQFVFCTYSTANSARPWAQAVGSIADIECWVVGVT